MSATRPAVLLVHDLRKSFGAHLVLDASPTDIATDIKIEMKIKEELKRHFRPEFLNRIDETIIFHRLSREDLAKIVDIQLRSLQQRLAGGTGAVCGTGFQPVGLTLTLTDRAKEQLARDGYEPAYGARPLKRLIQQEIENPLAKRILAGEFAPGDTVEVDACGELYEFAKRVGAEAA